MDSLSKIFKALGDKNRLRIVKMLQLKPLCVCEITSVLNLATSTVSKHLSILREAGLIKDKKDGKWVDYYLSNNGNSHYISKISPLISNWLNEDEQILMDAEKLKTADRIELCRQ